MPVSECADKDIEGFSQTFWISSRLSFRFSCWSDREILHDFKSLDFLMKNSLYSCVIFRESSVRPSLSLIERFAFFIYHDMRISKLYQEVKNEKMVLCITFRFDIIPKLLQRFVHITRDGDKRNMAFKNR